MASKVPSKPAAKKAAKKPAGGMTAKDHRNAAAKLSAQARLHHAKADLLDAINPPKPSKNGSLLSGY